MSDTTIYILFVTVMATVLACYVSLRGLLKRTKGKVFVFTDGAYSDYRIEAIFDSKLLAGEYLKFYLESHDDEYAAIEEYPLNPTYRGGD